MVKHGNWFQLYRIIVLYYSDIVLVTNWIAGTPLELKYSFRIAKMMNKFEIGQSAAKPRNRKVQRLSKTHI